MFERAMDVILASVKWQHAVVYTDVINNFSETPEEHLNHDEKELFFYEM